LTEHIDAITKIRYKDNGSIASLIQ